MITDKDYYRITNCVSVLGFQTPKFSLKEIQQFLIDIGYEIIIYKGQAKIHETYCDGTGSVERTGNTWDDERETILALKPIEKIFLNQTPLRVDSKEISEYNFLTVFEREYKERLLKTLINVC